MPEPKEVNPQQYRIVVGVDGSDESKEALRWASRLAGAYGGEIVAVHALGLVEALGGELVPGHKHRAEIEQVMANDWCGAVCRSGLGFRAVVREGDAINVLVDTAREEHADLLVVGSRGIGGAPALALGSTSLHVLQRCPVPVLVVPDRDRVGRHLALRRILVAVDGTRASNAAIEVAAELASVFGAGLEVVHAIEDIPVFPLGPAGRMSSDGEAHAPQRARRMLEPLCERARRRHVPVHLSIERGSPDDVLPDRAAAIDADLVVTATQRWGDAASPLLASVSRRTAGFGYRPTLVVPVTVADEQPARSTA